MSDTSPSDPPVVSDGTSPPPRKAPTGPGGFEVVADLLRRVGLTGLRKESLRAKAAAGAVWTLFGYGGSQMFRLASNLILARMLFPEAFGLMALVNVVVRGLRMCSDVGINGAIVHNPRGADPVFLNTAWSIQVIRGFALWATACIAAYPTAWFFSGSDESAWMLLWLIPAGSTSTIIAGSRSTRVITEKRRLRFARISVLQLMTLAARTVAMVGCAWIWPSVWALVFGGIVGAIFSLVMSYAWFEGPPHRFAIDKPALREIVGYGKWVFLSTIVTFLGLQLDRVILGKLVSMADLGLYSIALVFARPAVVVASQLSKGILFPVLATKNEDEFALMALCVRTREGVLWASGAACCCMVIGAPLFFRLLYEPRYEACGTIAQWLVLFTWANVLCASTENAPLALGRPRTLFAANVIRVIGMAGAVAGYATFALPGFVAALALGAIASHLYVISTLPHLRSTLLRQSVRFTGTVAGYALPSVLLLNSVDPANTWAPVGATVGLIVPPCFTSVVVIRRLLRSRPKTRKAVARALPD